MPRKPASKSSRPVGRPRFGTEPLSEILQFRVTPSQRDAIRAEAKRRRVNEIEIVRRALDLYFSRR